MTVGGVADRSFKLEGEKQYKEAGNQNGLSPYATPSISPTVSLTSSDSCASSCSDFSVLANTHERTYEEEGSTHGSRTNSVQESSLPTYGNGIHRSSKVAKSNGNGGTDVNKDGEFVGNGDEREARDDEIDEQFWMPPNPVDEVEASVANYDDDDDEYGDGTEWGKSGEHSSGSHRFEEEKQNAINAVMSGKFKALVCQLLESVGVSCSGNDNDSWAEIVTSLSWEAALFVKPEYFEGKAMDPDGYVKVKCIATDSPSQSRLIKGLVFKKHAAHKHMPTKYMNPRLLLVQGVLGHSSSGLSSFDAMKQEDDGLKSIAEKIEMCHPNVILVEKSVSRDIQESILQKGMTLVYDMKLHRLERVSRCTSSPILSLDNLIGQKLRQCNSFYIEKFVEEHAASGDGGKKSSKTLMFLEGCPTRLGCTILLKGADSDKLKRIKCVVRCAVIMAYHLILETSFLLDQRAMFSTIPSKGVAETANDGPLQFIGSDDAIVSHGEEFSVENNSSYVMDVPISTGSHEVSQNLKLGLGDENSLSFMQYNPLFLSGISSLSTSLKKVVGDSFPFFSTSRQSMTAYLGFNEKEPDSQIQSAGQNFSSPEATDYFDMEVKGSSDEDKAPGLEQRHHFDTEISLGSQKTDDTNEGPDGEQKRRNNDVNTVLDSESILVLMSRQNSSRGTICEQSHFSHIKFYRNFDVPLGKFLRDNLLNQNLLCNKCGESQEAHVYYYAHQNKQMRIQVKRLHVSKALVGETEGKLWMWSRCGKCKPHNKNSVSTKRVLISMLARGLSFGKFLALCFSNISSVSKQASCGHSFDRDFFFFFGLGPMVAMFRNSPIATYSVSLPPPKLEFRGSVGRDLLKKEFENVYEKGSSMFTEIGNTLKKIRSQVVGLGSTFKLGGSFKEFSDIEDMLKQERYQFEADFKSLIENGNSDGVYKLLDLNRMRWELLLHSCVWDQRLHALLSYESKATEYGDEDKTSNGSDLKNKPVTVIEENHIATKDNEIDEEVEVTREQEGPFTSSDVDERSTVGTIDGSFPGDNIPLSDQLEVCRNIPISGDLRDGFLDLNLYQKGKSQFPLLSKPNSMQLIWSPFNEIQHEYMNGFENLPKFESITSHSPESTPHKLINDEGSRLHICIGSEDQMVSDYEDELSSIIACALALLKDLSFETGVGEKGLDSKTFEKLGGSLTRISSLTSQHWSSFGSFDSDGIHSWPSMSLEDSHFSSLNGLDYLRTTHPEVTMGKSPGKVKYSVACLYASQFRDLRNRWCPSEVDYIASLSRCRNWDAKGGKSKSFFAKTLGDRFIIKEIKRTEFESFTKFAPDYFDYMNQCYESGNQTCLAKILGIYQVRQTKNGKETKHDVMVMENLTFGRHITRQYDLKGALHARFNSVVDGSEDVLLDQNFVNDMNFSPLYVSRKAKRNLQRAVWNDTSFLNSVNVMDYSLLVGVDKQRRELVCGIIDYLRQYTWDKQLEHWVKASLVVSKNQFPTIVSPKDYKKRFRKFIDTYFLSVPDHWCGSQISFEEEDSRQ